MSEYLSEEEQVERMKSWWDANGNTVIVAIVITIAGVVGFKWYEHNARQQALEAAEQYAAYMSADETARPDLAKALAQAHPGSAYHAFVLFEQADSALAGGDLAGSEAALQQVVETADDDLLVDLARVRLAKLMQQGDRSEQALGLLDQVSQQGYRAWALEAKGDIHMARGEIELAHQAYQAAVADLREGDDRPLLQMKLDNTAPYDGEYVELTDSLESALRQAADALAAPEAADEPEADASASPDGEQD